MAFGRKKRRQVAEGGEAPGSAAGTAVEPSPAPEATEPDSAGPTAVGDDVAQAAVHAGDSAAAGTDSEASGPEPTLEPASSGYDAASSVPAPSAASTVDRAEALVEQRPELLVLGAFAGGLVLARVIAALGGRR